mgnify:CR=1 FL=1
MLNETTILLPFKMQFFVRMTKEKVRKNMAERNKKEETKYEHIHFRISKKHKEIIEANARKCDLSVGEYLRQCGVGITPRSHEHLERINDLVHINGDLGRLGGLLKLWLTDDLKVSYYGRTGIVRLLREIEVNRLQLEDVLEKILNT